MINRLKAFRVEAGLTQAEVAQKVGVTQPTYQRWETGAGSIPATKLSSLAKLFATATIKLLGKEPPAEARIYDDAVPDELCHYGEVSIHFAKGGDPLLLTISEKEFAKLHRSLQGEHKFLSTKSLANQTVILRTEAVSDLYFSSEAFDDYGPEHSRYSSHISVQIPDSRDWEIIEALAADEVGIEDFSEDDVARVEQMIMITKEQYQSLVADGRIKTEDLDSERNKNQLETDRIFEASSKVVYQLSNGYRRSIFVDNEIEIYNAFYGIIENDDNLDETFVRIEAEGRHRIVFINKNSLDYAIIPTHKYEKGDIEAAADAIDN